MMTQRQLRKLLQGIGSRRLQAMESIEKVDKRVPYPKKLVHARGIHFIRKGDDLSSFILSSTTIFLILGYHDGT